MVDNVSLDKTSAVCRSLATGAVPAARLSCTSSRRALIRLKRAKKCETWVTFDETVDIQRIHGGIDRKLRPENNFGEHLFLKMCMGTLTQPEERTRRKLLTGESFWNTNKEKHCEFCGKGRIRIDGLFDFGGGWKRKKGIEFSPRTSENDKRLKPEKGR